MDHNFIFRKSEFSAGSGRVSEDFYINRQGVPNSNTLLHLQLWLDSVWNGYEGSNTASESTAFLGLVLSGRQSRQTGDSDQNPGQTEFSGVRCSPSSFDCRLPNSTDPI